MTQRFFHSCEPRFVLDTIDPGWWGREVSRQGSRHPEWNRERVLETIRQREYAHLPSRFGSIFLFDSLTAADSYAAQYQGHANAPPRALLEVEVCNQMAPVHRAWWGPLRPYDPGGDWARRYWNGDCIGIASDGSALHEVLVESPVKVIRRIR